MIQRMEDIVKCQGNAPDYDDPVSPNIQDEFWDKIEAQKLSQARFQGRRGEGREKRKISVQSCSLYWNFVQ